MNWKKNKGVFLAILIAVLLGLIFLLNYKLRESIRNSKTIANNYAALQDTMKTVINSDSSKTSTIKAFETSKANDILKINSQDKTINDLQSIVKKYEKQLAQGGSSTVFNDSLSLTHSSPTSSTTKDTIIIGVNKYIYPEYKSEFNLDGWVKVKTKANKDTTKVELGIRNEYSVVVGKEGDQSVAWVTNKNPYSSVLTMRAANFTLPKTKQKKLGIGFHVGYGAHITKEDEELKVKPGFNISVGLNYNLINIK